MVLNIREVRQSAGNTVNAFPLRVGLSYQEERTNPTLMMPAHSTAPDNLGKTREA